MKKLIALFIFVVCTGSAVYSQLTLQLDPVDYNGSNISCFGLSDGRIDLTITNGTPPYIIGWSNRATTEDIIDLAAGYYRVTVQDANFELAVAEITLTEPLAIDLSFTPYRYPNGYNISQYGACNGSVDVVLTGGTAPFTFLWTPGLQTIEEPSNLCAGDHSLEVTDANGCTTHLGLPISQPERSDWQITGNANTNPSSQFIGTTDAKDLSFRTGSNEALRIKANGDLKITPLQGTELRIAYIDENGILKAGATGVTPAMACPSPALAWFNGWSPGDVVKCPTFGLVGIGTLTPQYKVDITGTLRNTDNAYLATASGKGVSIGSTTVPSGIRLNVNGKVSIGTPSSYPGSYNLYVTGGILTEKVRIALSGSAAWFDFVFSNDYKLKSISELEEFIKANKHLPEIPTTEEVMANGTDIGEIQGKLLQKIEELTLYIIQQDKTIIQQGKRIEKLENEKK